MYSKTRNTLTALAVAALFVAGGWLLGGPAASSATQGRDYSALPVVLANADIDAQDPDIQDTPASTDARQVVVLRSHRANRMSLSMPYFSFVQVLPQRRAD